MAYERTSVSVAQSQESIRRLIYAHKGTGVMFTSRRPSEGLEALVTMRGKPYHIRIQAKAKPQTHEDRWRQEEQRVWRVLFYHLKAIFEAADADVLSIEEIIMPYVVTPDGRTLAEHILPRLAELQAHPGNLLPELGVK